MKRNILFLKVVLFLGLYLILGTSIAIAKSAKEIDSSVDVALDEFAQQVKGSKEFLATAKGVLVFPSVLKAGVGI